MNKTRIILMAAAVIASLFFLGQSTRKNMDLESLGIIASAQAEETGNPVLAYKTADGTRRFILPTGRPGADLAKKDQELQQEQARSGKPSGKWFGAPVKEFFRKKTHNELTREQMMWRMAPDVIRRIERQYGAIITVACTTYNVSRAQVLAYIYKESGGNPYAVSSANAKGLMQLKDETAEDMGVRNIFNPRDNIMGGVKYHRYLLDQFGHPDAAMAAYNIGPGDYVRKIQSAGLNPANHQYVKDVKLIMRIVKSI